MKSTPCTGFNVGNLQIEINLKNNSINKSNKVEWHMEYIFHTQRKRRKKRTYNAKKKKETVFRLRKHPYL